MTNDQERLYVALLNSRKRAAVAIAANQEELVQLLTSMGDIEAECERTVLASKDPVADFELFFPTITGQHNNRTGSNLDVHQREYRRNVK